MRKWKVILLTIVALLCIVLSFLLVISPLVLSYILDEQTMAELEKYFALLLLIIPALFVIAVLIVKKLKIKEKLENLR